jgi:hypothetical protein
MVGVDDNNRPISLLLVGVSWSKLGFKKTLEMVDINEKTRSTNY